MLSITLLIGLLAVLSVTVGLAPGRSSDDPPATVTVTQTVTGTYRGVSAARWAAKFRGRTRQFQQTRRLLKRSWQPLYTSTLEKAFMCIHEGEGSWTDDGAPFWGGLQMDYSFQDTYGNWALKAFGTADHWPVSVQLSVAIRAKVSGRGFYPWPTTARYCGLI